MRKILIAYTLVFISCAENDKTFYAKDLENKILAADKTEIPPPPGGPVYNIENNFIIDSSDNVFYYKGKDFKIEQCVIPKSITPDTRPEYFGLSPNELKNINSSSIDDFLEKNLVLDGFEFVIVASVRDSFRSPALSKISNYLISKYGNERILIRKTTHEEEVVLNHKKAKRQLNPFTYPWDATRIKMADNFARSN